MRTGSAAPVIVLCIAVAFTLFAQEPSGPRADGRALERSTRIDDSVNVGEVHRYYVDLVSGSLFIGTVDQITADVVITVKGPDGSTIAAIDGMPGPEHVEFEVTATGRHWLEIAPFMDIAIGRYGIRIDSILTPQEYRAQKERDQALADSVSAYIGDNAVRIRTVAAGSGFEDLQPLKAFIGDARIVGLGEASHGTREFFQFKHRMLEFLVTEMGFTAFAIEAIMPEAFDIDRYVYSGEGDPGKALAAQYFWTWDTQEVLALIEWMRQYNADPSHTRKLRFYGNDMQMSTRAAKVVAAFLDRVDSPTAQVLRDSLRLCLNAYTESFLAGGTTKATRARLLPFGEKVLNTLRENEQRFTRATSSTDYRFALIHANVLVQFLRMIGGDMAAGSYIRDSAMAANTKWILDSEGPDGKIVLWAHNAHVADDSLAMGWHLRRMYGAGYRNIGMLFNQGSFQAYEDAGNINRPTALNWFSVPPAGRGTPAWTFANAGIKLGFIDLWHLGPVHPVYRWFSVSRPVSEFGALYSDTLPAYASIPEVYAKYDGLFYVDSTTAALATPYISVGRATMIQPILANGDFEVIDANAQPQCWSVSQRQLRFDYSGAVTSQTAYSGGRCLVLERPAGSHYGEAVGTALQRIRARAWRGRTIRISVTARVEALDPESHAYISMTGDVKPVGTAYTQLLDSTISVEVTSPDWKTYEVIGQVGDSAAIISVGLHFVGNGRAYFDAVKLSGAEPL